LSGKRFGSGLTGLLLSSVVRVDGLLSLPGAHRIPVVGPLNPIKKRDEPENKKSNKFLIKNHSG